MSKFSHLPLGENLTDKTQHDLMKMANAKKKTKKRQIRFFGVEPLVTLSSLAEFCTNFSEYKLV